MKYSHKSDLHLNAINPKTRSLYNINQNTKKKNRKKYIKKSFCAICTLGEKRKRKKTLHSLCNKSPLLFGIPWYAGQVPWAVPLAPSPCTTIYLGARDLPYRKKIVVFLPRVRIETYGVCKKTWLGRGLLCGGEKEGSGIG